MAMILKIDKAEEKEEIKKKVAALEASPTSSTGKQFPATRFTGKIKSFEDGLAYQRNVRNEWD
jgi:hypothetical protein